MTCANWNTLSLAGSPRVAESPGAEKQPGPPVECGNCSGLSISGSRGSSSLLVPTLPMAESMFSFKCGALGAAAVYWSVRGRPSASDDLNKRPRPVRSGEDVRTMLEIDVQRSQI